jgi:hypothetical protein
MKWTRVDDEGLEFSNPAAETPLKSVKLTEDKQLATSN